MTEDQCRALATASGIDAGAIDGASLAPLAARIGKDAATPPLGRWPWVLTLGTRGVRRSGGSQFGPACLAEDAKPYLRMEWRLAWHTACEHHRAGLHDRCPVRSLHTESNAPLLRHVRAIAIQFRVLTQMLNEVHDVCGIEAWMFFKDEPVYSDSGDLRDAKLVP